jgi:hypothetical protein
LINLKSGYKIAFYDGKLKNEVEGKINKILGSICGSLSKTCNVGRIIGAQHKR